MISFSTLESKQGYKPGAVDATLTTPWSARPSWSARFGRFIPFLLLDCIPNLLSLIMRMYRLVVKERRVYRE